MRLCEDEQVVASGDGLLPPRDGVAQARYCAPDGCGRSAAWKKSSRRGPFRAAPVAREAGPARSPVAAQMSQRWALSRDADSEAPKAPIGDSTSTTRRLAPIARTSQNNVWTKVPLPSNFEQTGCRVPDQPKRRKWWGKAGGRLTTHLRHGCHAAQRFEHRNNEEQCERGGFAAQSEPQRIARMKLVRW